MGKKDLWIGLTAVVAAIILSITQFWDSRNRCLGVILSD